MSYNVVASGGGRQWRWVGLFVLLWCRGKAQQTATAPNKRPQLPYTPDKPPPGLRSLFQFFSFMLCLLSRLRCTFPYQHKAGCGGACYRNRASAALLLCSRDRSGLQPPFGSALPSLHSASRPHQQAASRKGNDAAYARKEYPQAHKQEGGCFMLLRCKIESGLVTRSIFTFRLV